MNLFNTSLILILCLDSLSFYSCCFIFFSAYNPPYNPGVLNSVTCSSSRQSNSNSSLLQTKVGGGNNAALGQYPWQVYIFGKLEGSNYISICGASLINNQWLLTAAHCDKTPGYTWYAKLGDYDIKIIDGETQIKTSSFIKVTFNFFFLLAISSITNQYTW